MSHRLGIVWLSLVLAGLWLGGCAPTAEGNVLSFLAAKRLGSLPTPAGATATGVLTGYVTNEGEPVSGATVVVAEPAGRPHSAQTGADGRYRITGIPPGQYVPAAVAPGYEETVLTDFLGIRQLVTIQPLTVTLAPVINLPAHQPVILPAPLAQSVALSQTATYTATAVFPTGAQAQVSAFQFTYAAVTLSTLRLYTPIDGEPDAQLPLLFMIYPTHTDGWESVSVAFADQGYALVAISPAAERAVDIQAHAIDARVAFHLAREGALGPHLNPAPAIALGGSFSSAILSRFLRDERPHIAGWITVGGISNTFSGAEDFYTGRIELPPPYELAIPALGPPNVFPLTFLRYSPVYTAAAMPPTMIIHTDADTITPIDQAYQLEAALRAANVPVEVFYYEDVSHYLQIGDQLTEAGKEMYYRILDFVERYHPAVNDPANQ